MRPRNPGEDSSETRQRLIAAAAEVFAEDGVAAARLEDIAARAGYTRGALYWNFAGKQELLHAVLDSITADVDSSGDEVPDANELARLMRSVLRDPDRRAKIRSGWLLAIEFALHAIRTSPNLRRGLIRRYDDMTTRRTPVIRSWLRNAPVDDAQLALIGRIHQALEDGFLLQWQVDERRFPLEDWVDAQQLVMTALGDKFRAEARRQQRAAARPKPRAASGRSDRG